MPEGGGVASEGDADALPSVEVRYERLSYTVHLPPDEFAGDVLPSLPRVMRCRALAVARAVTRRPQPRVALHALNSVSGVLRAGSSTLLICAPGGGATTLLRLLAGQLPPQQRPAQGGHGGGAPTYNGATEAELAVGGVALTRLASYAPERDEHEPLLTVSETFSFSHAAAVGIPIAAARARAAAAARGVGGVWGWWARSAEELPPSLLEETVRAPAPAPAPPPPPPPPQPPQPPPPPLAPPASAVGDAAVAGRAAGMHSEVGRVTASVATGVAAGTGVKPTGPPVHASAAAAAARQPDDAYWLRPRTADEMMVELLQLREAADTIVGSAVVRGASGGQRKRVTIGEALMQGARVLALDSITSGLDASTAHATCRYITEWARRSGEWRRWV